MLRRQRRMTINAAAVCGNPARPQPTLGTEVDYIIQQGMIHEGPSHNHKRCVSNEGGRGCGHYTTGLNHATDMP